MKIIRDDSLEFIETIVCCANNHIYICIYNTYNISIYGMKYGLHMAMGLRVFRRKKPSDFSAKLLLIDKKRPLPSQKRTPETTYGLG